MMKIIVLFLLSLFSLLFAKTKCYDFDEYVGRFNDLVEIKKFIEKNAKQRELDKCISEGGEGSVFRMASSSVRYGECGNESNPDSDYMSGSTNGYLEITFACNKCEGEKLKNELDRIEAECNDACMESIAYCKKPSLPYSSWGGYIVNGDECGETLPECLSEGSSSSVGEEEQSSSSQELLSSDSQYSSFEVESSSSEEYDPESSDSGINSSSSDDGGDDPSSSSGIGEQGTQCYIGDDESCQPWSGVIFFKKRPVLLGDIRMCYHKPYCQDDGNIVFRANIPVAYFHASSGACLKEDCMSYHSIEGFWECNDGSQQINGCSVVPEHRSIPFYYSVLTKELKTSWMKVNFSSNPDPNLEMSLPYFDVSDLLKVVADAGVYEGNGDFDKDLKELYPQFSINSFDDYVRACAYHLGIDVSSSSESLQSSSSVIAKSSSSSYMSSSSEESSSSVEESSSSYECSSSSMEYEESSSSAEIESSSSYFVESLSSMLIESSSSKNAYSSNNDGYFVSGGDQEHTPDQIFNGGLDNMKSGSCYSLNPDRGTQYGWMNTDAKDSWWWREVDCETGEKVDRDRVGQCPGFPLDRVPSNPKRSCIAYNGKCYRCKSENSYVDCSQEWLWKWTFNVQNIGSWYAEVDCYNPAYVGSPLYKIAEDFNTPSDDIEKSVGVAMKKVYDAMGRRKSIRNMGYDRMPLYRK